MYRLLIHVKPNAKKMEQLMYGVLSKRFHAFILATLRNVNPELAQTLHSNKERQQFSFYLDKQQILLHSPSEAVIQSLQQGLLQQNQIDLRTWKGHVQEISCWYFSEAEIMSRFSNYMTLFFRTPTTFFQEGKYYPLPELHHLLVSANKAYEMSTRQHVSSDVISELAFNIRIERVKIDSERVDFGEFRVLGCRGRLDLNLKGMDMRDQQLAWKLLVYGSLLGFGYKTAWGLGQTCMEPFESSFSDDR